MTQPKPTDEERAAFKLREWERIADLHPGAASPSALDVDYLRDKLLDQHPHSQEYIEEAFREAEWRASLTEQEDRP